MKESRLIKRTKPCTIQNSVLRSCLINCPTLWGQIKKAVAEFKPAIYRSMVDEYFYILYEGVLLIFIKSSDLKYLIIISACSSLGGATVTGNDSLEILNPCGIIVKLVEI